jgi:hypothetical protein
MTHTKGKWETYSYYDLDDREWFCVRSNRGKYICEETTEGDANLIASAPDLLSDYKELLGRVNTMAKAMRSNDLGEWVDEWLSDGILSGDTIAKAERPLFYSNKGKK